MAPAGSGYSFSFSLDNAAWKPVAGTDLDSHFPTIYKSFADKSFPPCYQYYLKCELSGSAQLTSLSIENDIQMNGLAMPGMVVGANTFQYTDENSGDRNVRITHEWVERSASKPPSAPPSPVYPANGGESNGTDIVFKWSAQAPLKATRLQTINSSFPSGPT